MEFKDRVRAARKHANLNQAELAKKVGINQSVVSKIELGRYLQSRYAVAIAISCGVNPTWLASGKGEMLGDDGVMAGDNFEPAPIIKPSMAPEISWIQAGAFSEVAHIERDPELIDWHPMPSNAGERTFVLRVVGESMMPEYPPNRLIYVDPDRAPVSGDDVVASMTETGEATFKRYIEEPGSGKMLKAINPAWEPQYVKINGNCHIVGVVIADMRLR